MSDLTVPRDEVEAYSYVAVAQGSKRHNMAKVYAGFINITMKLCHQKATTYSDDYYCQMWYP